MLQGALGGGCQDPGIAEPDPHRLEPPDWLGELDLHVGPPDAVVGTRSLDVSSRSWLDVPGATAGAVAHPGGDGRDERPDDHPDDAAGQAALAAWLLQQRRDAVLAVAPTEVVDPARLDASVASLVAAATEPLAAAGVAAPTGEGGGADVLARLRGLVADDLALLLPDDGGRWRLAAAAVCFPSYWHPARVVGLPMADVHGPVPGYAGTVAGRVDSLLHRLAPGRAVRRRNWSIHDDPALHLPERRDLPRPTAVPAGRWLRSERQVLLRLPGDEPVVAFGIRTQQVPLAALAARPDVCAGLLAALRGWSPEQRAYKGGAVDDALLGWLGRAGS